jgi:hypothetical protein
MLLAAVEGGRPDFGKLKDKAKDIMKDCQCRTAPLPKGGGWAGTVTCENGKISYYINPDGLTQREIDCGIKKCVEEKEQYGGEILGLLDKCKDICKDVKERCAIGFPRERAGDTKGKPVFAKCTRMWECFTLIKLLECLRKLGKQHLDNGNECWRVARRWVQDNEDAMKNTYNCVDFGLEPPPPVGSK